MTNFKESLATAAPFLSSMFDSPLRDAAINIVGSVLLENKAGKRVGMKDLARAFITATAKQLHQLKKLDTDYQSKMSHLGLDKLQLVLLKNSFKPHQKMFFKDHMRVAVAIILTIGFFSILITLMTCPLPASTQNAVYILLGSLGTTWITVISYYFGSSRDSAVKTQMLQEKMSTNL
jgi:hypothetical protein